MIEDSAADAELIEDALKRAGVDIVTTQVDSRDTFARALSEFSPDVVLCDHSLASFNMHSAMQLMRKLRPAVPLIVVTGMVDAQLAVACVRDGADDVVFKTQLEGLPGAISSALKVRRDLEKLSPRQLQVLQLVAEGYSTPDIAKRLQLSSKTVDTYRTELMERLGIHDVVALVHYAIRAGLVAL
ncbi:MAG TPA: response regulator transcription factor [Gemmatimonadaceae bacterium]|nr:response regulator transcription factor [Gemmatimonadaceae bacterium]